MTIFLPLLQFNNLTGLGLFATLCHSPNPSEFMLIVAAVTGMVGALVVLIPASAVTMVFMATTIVEMIMAGATLESIAGAISCCTFKLYISSPDQKSSNPLPLSPSPPLPL
ncbi:hypothetical protein Q5692_14690 [Microcoleus sp. C2C3]|uniref:hypothetical protein n=1 Tax=unclassified Microcoleus TaxID=2642155 RepID=UPI002FD79B3B